MNSSVKEDRETRGLRMLLRSRKRHPLPAVHRPEPSPASPPEPTPDHIEDIRVTVDLQPLCVRIPIAAQLLGLCRTTMYNLINDGELEVVKLRGATLISMESLQAIVHRNCTSRLERKRILYASKNSQKNKYSPEIR